MNKLQYWADAHVFYSLYNRKSVQNLTAEEKIEDEWRKKVIKNSPNGKLLLENAFFSSLKNDKKIYLGHITYNLHEIKKTKALFPSGGCLVGSVYCFPITETNKKLRLHNLGEYIYNKEAQLIAHNRKGKPALIVFEISLENTNHKHNLIGIDYLKLGEVQFELYKELEYLLSSKEKFELYQTIISKVREALNYLTLCNENQLKPEALDVQDFFSVFIPAVKNLPILGYFYFEVISEYLMLYQETKNSLHYAKAGEFYNPTYKELMYALHPGLKRSSRLSEFYPGLNKLITYLETAKLFKQFDGDHFTKYLMNRLICLTNSRLFDLSENLIDWRRFEWNFENLALKAKRLVGHLIHRELRSFGRYPNFYFYFDQTKALQAWNYWNHMNIIIPFNGTFPKGEVGINPAYPDLNYKAYIGNVNKNNNYSYVEPIEEIKFEIEPRLVDLRHTQMRASGRFIND